MDDHTSSFAPTSGEASAPAMSLAGLKVLDLSRILAAPTCTQLFGDLGADVIKVERPGKGDDTRTWGPPFVPTKDGSASDLSAYFLCANRNKRSIAVDMSTEAGCEVIKQLVAWADVVIENYKPGDLKRRGLDYDAVKNINPSMIWCSITGFGQTGPYSDRIGYDFLIQAMGGIMSITGPEGEDSTPYKVGVGISDVMCGMYAATGILAALRHRDATGEGQHIDLSLYDSQVAWLINAATNYLTTGNRPKRLGNRHPNIVPYQVYPAQDGHFVIATGNDGQFKRFVAEIGCPELGDDPRFLTNADRLKHVDPLEELVAPYLKKATIDEWVDRFTKVGVPAGPVSTLDQVLTNDHTLARDMVIEMTSPAATDPVRLVGNPLKMSATPVQYRHAPPSLDEGRSHVLETVLSLSNDKIQELTKGGAFGRPTTADGE